MGGDVFSHYTDNGDKYKTVAKKCCDNCEWLHDSFCHREPPRLRQVTEEAVWPYVEDSGKKFCGEYRKRLEAKWGG